MGEQRISLSARHIAEIQTIRTFATHIDEVQSIKISGADGNEIQTIEITENRHTQIISPVGLTQDTSGNVISSGAFRLTYFDENTREYSPCLEYTISQSEL